MTNVIFPGINTDNSGDVYAGANSNLAYEEMNTLANTSKPIDIGGGIFIILAKSQCRQRPSGSLHCKCQPFQSEEREILV